MIFHDHSFMDVLLLLLLLLEHHDHRNIRCVITVPSFWRWLWCSTHLFFLPFFAQNDDFTGTVRCSIEQQATRVQTTCVGGAWLDEATSQNWMMKSSTSIIIHSKEGILKVMPKDIWGKSWTLKHVVVICLSIYLFVYISIYRSRSLSLSIYLLHLCIHISM